MANGYDSLHPVQAEALKECGVPSHAVTQGWGYARASAGYHDPEGTINGRRFSSCFDLSMSVVTPNLLNRLVQAAIAPFVRTRETGWGGSAHCHCVSVGLVGDTGKPTILPGPRSQIKDWCEGQNGLRGHDMQPHWQGWRQSRGAHLSQVADLRAHYEAWVPDYATAVYTLANRVPCYAWYEALEGKVRCDVRMFVGALGGYVTWDAEAGQAQAYDNYGKPIALPSGKVEVDFFRASVRELGEAFGYEVKFRWEGAAARVDLVRE